MGSFVHPALLVFSVPMFGKGVGGLIQPNPIMCQLRNLISAKKFMAIAGRPAKRLQQPNTHQHGYFIRQKSQEIRRLIHIKAGRQAGHRKYEFLIHIELTESILPFCRRTIGHKVFLTNTPSGIRARNRCLPLLTRCCIRMFIQFKAIFYNRLRVYRCMNYTGLLLEL